MNMEASDLAAGIALLLFAGTVLTWARIMEALI